MLARREIVAKMRAEGWTFAAIGSKLGVSRQRANKIFHMGQQAESLTAAR